jgi:WD40 repeat protein
MVATASRDRVARVFRAGRAPAGRSLIHADGVYDLAFSPDGKTVVTACKDGSVRGWDVAAGRPIGPILWHADEVHAVAFRPDGRTIVTGSWENGGQVQVWDLAGGRRVGPGWPAVYNACRVVVVSPDGRTVLTGGGVEGANLWEVATGRPLPRPFEHLNSIEDLAFSPDGRLVAAGFQDWTARILDTSTRRPTTSVLAHQESVRSVAFRPDGRRVVTGSYDRTARQWDTTTGEPVGKPLLHSDRVEAVAYSPDGRLIATATSGHDRAAYFWMAETGGRIGPPLAHEDRVWALEFSPDGKTLATASQDKTARLWDVPAIRSDAGDDPRLRVEALTGLTIDDDLNSLRLDEDAWHDRREHLTAQGGGSLPAAVDAASPPGPDLETPPPFDLGAERTAALWEVVAGSPQGYRRRCRTILQRSELRGIWYAAERAAKACLLRPGDPEILARASALAALSDRRSNGSMWAKFVVGLSEYRRGLDESALATLRLCRAGSEHFAEPERWHLRAMTLGAEAMALVHLDRPAEARRSLAEAWQTLETAFPGSISRAPDPDQDYDLAYSLLLLREAEAVVVWDPVFPVDPFAPLP